jgi:hypothetical protein
MQLASGQRAEWNCPCPFCGRFAAEQPFDYTAGHAWFADNSDHEPEPADMQPGGRLFDAYPLLSEPAPGGRRTAVNFSRMGHNHWALTRIMGGLNASSGHRDRMVAHVEGVIERYERATNSPRFAAAVRFSLALAAGDLSP